MKRSAHLSEAQLYESLDGRVPVDAQAHLSTCVHCRTEIEALQTSLAGLRVSATSLARTTFQPRLNIHRHEEASWFSRALPSWSLSLVTVGLVCAASLSFNNGPATPQNAAETRAAIETVPSQSDDALLDGIDQDLSNSVPPSLAPLAVSGAEGVEAAQNLN